MFAEFEAGIYSEDLVDRTTLAVTAKSTGSIAFDHLVSAKYGTVSVDLQGKFD